MSEKDKDKDKEKFWNLLIYKIYATNKEMEEMFPIFGLVSILCIFAFAIFIILTY